MRRRLAAAVLHLVLGGFLPGVEADDASANAGPVRGGRAHDVVVDFDLTPADKDDGDEADEDRTSHVAAALAKAGVEVVVLDVGPALPPVVAESLVRRALRACRVAGTLKVVIPAPVPLTADALCALAKPLGFQFTGVRRRDNALELYRDLYARRT